MNEVDAYWKSIYDRCVALSKDSRAALVQKADFEKNLLSDAKWISDIPNDMIGITSYFCDIQTSDYYIIYNRDTGEFNKLPSESGTYVFINVLYNAESNTMKLVEYQIEYTK